MSERPVDRAAMTDALALPRYFADHVQHWLAVNEKRRWDVRHGLFPLGMVQRWIERAEAAEARVVQLEAQLADAEKALHEMAECGGLDAGVQVLRILRDYFDRRAAVSVADSGPEECQHPSASFDRTICACGSMHHYCDACGKTLDCPLDSGPEEKKP